MDALRALVIDDEDSWRDDIAAGLRDQGFTVHTAGTYEAATTCVEAANQGGRPYDLCTVDLQLSEALAYSSASFELIEKLLDAGTPVVVISWFTEPPLVNQMLRTYGFLGFLNKHSWKPQDMQQVVETVSGQPPRQIGGRRKLKPKGWSQHLEALLLEATRRQGVLAGPVTWLHLSDLHQRPNDSHNVAAWYNADLVHKKLLDDLHKLENRHGLRPDFMVFTGDVAFSGKSAQYEEAARSLDRLLKVTHLDRERLFIVPGNHDVDRSAIDEVGAQECRRALAGRDSVTGLLARSSPARRRVWKKFRGYSSFVSTFLGASAPGRDEVFYARSVTVRGLKIAVLGLNSAWMSSVVRDANNDGEYADEGNLIVGEAQVRAALDTPEAQTADLRIALLHHPLDVLCRFDSSDLYPLLYGGCHFVLHGHRHEEAISGFIAPYGSAAVLGAGACYNRRDQPNTYHFCQFDPTTRQVTVTMRRYSDRAGGFWAADTLSFPQADNGVYTFQLP